VSLVREGLPSRRKAPFCIEALACVADLVEGLGQAMGIYIDGLLEPMFSAGLRYVSTLTSTAYSLFWYNITPLQLMHTLCTIACSRQYIAAIPDRYCTWFIVAQFLLLLLYIS
jgi:hypothetical protein